MPNSATFFITYETTKGYLHNYGALSHVVAASAGEVASCLVRVPYEVIKMRLQVKTINVRTIYAEIITREGYIGLYRGFTATVFRDVPFSALQYPIWELLKENHMNRNKRPATTAESAYYGSIAGGIAAFVTNPLDVAKTRVMIAKHNDPLASGKLVAALRAVHSETGIRGLFSGVVPRVIWISVGAAIFLGSYETALQLLTSK